MNEDQAYSPGAEHPMNQYNVKFNDLPAVRKEVEPDANFNRNGQMVIHTPNQANIFETEKTANKNVHRSFFFDDLPDPAEPYDDPNATAHN
jgi:hypothetical protein